MPTLNIKPTHKPIKNYYTELKEYEKIGVAHEGTVRSAFQSQNVEKTLDDVI